MSVLSITLLTLALFGQAALWVGYFNRVHGIGLPETLVRILSSIGHVVFGVVPLTAFGFALRDGWLPPEKLSSLGHDFSDWIYLAPWWGIALVVAGVWVARRVGRGDSARMMANDSHVVDIARHLGFKPVAGLRGRILSHLPGNQMLQLAVQEKHLAIERLPQSLEGFSIAHLSDLHFTGTIGVEFFEEVVRRTNELAADLVVISGDIADEADCFEWIPRTLGRLTAPLGVYFVLGNHDLFHGRPDRLRQILAESGLIDLHGCWQRLDVRGTELILAGTEVPWTPPEPDMTDCPAQQNRKESGQLRVLVSHTPDQIGWATRHDFDLMLAGHTHGGQFRLPLIGPILSPSLHGVKYAGGVFYSKPTLMHVSRGISADFPLRMNCRPELAKLVLRRPSA
jgi:predicted MPP superfamily phosphohydrolase